MFADAEKEFLNARSICRMATISEDGYPHNIPVGYAFDGERFYVSTEYGTRKLKNLRRDPRLCLVVDDPQKPRRAVVVMADAEVLEKGEQFRKALRVIVGQRGERWGFEEGEQAILQITPRRKISWGLS